MSIPNLRSLSLVAVLLLAAGGCSTVSVKTDVAPGVDFSAYKTFSQTAPPKSAGAALPGYSEIAGENINASIAHALEMKGFSRVGSGRGDLIVTFSVDGEPRQDVQWDGGYGGYYGDTYTVNYTRGTLAIDIFDAGQKKLVFHAYGQTDLYGSSDYTNKVDSAVQQILKGFPPEPKE